MAEEHDDILWTEMQFAVGEICYCWRIANHADRAKVMAMFREVFNEYILHAEYSPLFCDAYKLADVDEGYEKYLETLPNKDPPELFAIAGQNWLSDRTRDSNGIIIKVLQKYYSYELMQTESNLDSAKVLINNLMEIMPAQLSIPVFFLVAKLGREEGTIACSSSQRSEKL
eukprot:TRINITY_DN10860_c0_g2_i3.p1 TRINITY_DN10860_c0_g2~~TRINITY_DN10860_c0_g2_i3.p1  ORF type:complete len:171 (+),score=28.38 TRINITY_DN10860_c0_g2_i3:209-721(+)